MRICDIFISIQINLYLYCSILTFAVENYPPVFPVESRVHVDFINVVFVCFSALTQEKEVSLSNFAVKTHFCNGLLNILICKTSPIPITLLTAAYPLSSWSHKISERIQINNSKAWLIGFAIRWVMEFDAEAVLIEPRIALRVFKDDLLKRRSSDVSY